MGHKNEYLIRLSDDRRTEEWILGNIEIESGKYEGSGYYRMIHAESFDEAIEKWNDTYCPTDLKRIWGECGVNERFVMVINHKGYIKYYM